MNLNSRLYQIVLISVPVALVLLAAVLFQPQGSHGIASRQAPSASVSVPYFQPYSASGIQAPVAPSVLPENLDLDAALQEALKEKEPGCLAELLARWAKSVPLNAIGKFLESSKSISDSDLRSKVRGALLTRWAGVDPGSAMAALWHYLGPSVENPAGNPEWFSLLDQVEPKWIRKNPIQAVTWIQSMPDSPLKKAVLTQMDGELRMDAGNWVQYDPNAAAAWAASLPAGEGQENAVTFLATVWAHQNPASAANYAVSLASDNLKNRAVDAVVRTWTLTAPMQASQWVQQLPDGPIRQEATQTLIETWARTDSNAAAQWLDTVPAGPTRDAGISTFCSAVGSSSPSIAFQAAESISSESMRNSRLQNLFGIWMSQDPAAAQQAIAQSDLPQDIKNILLPGSAQ